MKIEKICEYLNEIGIIEYENINEFLNIYSTLNKSNYSSKENKIIDTLKIYLNNNFVNKNQISKLCGNIISSFNNYQLISKYQNLNNMNSILLSKLRNRYIIFFLNLSLYLLKKDPKEKPKINKLGKKPKSKKNINKFNKYENIDNNNMNLNEENFELISSDDERECTFTPQINKNFKGYKKNNINNNIESHVYYSPAFNISSKFPINKYQTNIYTNQSISDNNMNNNSYSNLNISNDNRSNISYNQFGNNNFNQFPEQIYNKEYNLNYNNSAYSNYNFNNNKLIQSNYNNNNINRNNQNQYNNYNYSNISESNERNAEIFFNKELYHIQKVKDKIENLKIEKLNKLKEECTFKPKINTNYKSFYPEKDSKNKENDFYIKEKSVTIPIKNKDNLNTIKEGENKEKLKKEKRKRAYSEKKKGIKIIEDLSLARKKRTEKTKRLMKEKNFTPKITKNDKYKVTMSFEDRRLKSIELRNKYKKAKKPENDNVQNNIEGILAPGEMVRFKENINQDNNDNNKLENNVNNDINSQNLSEKDNNIYDKLNMDKQNIEKNDIKIKENIIDSEENINHPPNDNNNITNLNKDNFESNNFEINKEIIKENTENEIEKNKMFLMDKIKGEHKIGFKAKKEEENKEIKITEENNESENKIDLDMKIKNDEFSFQNFHARSKSLKDVLKKTD